jgi:hypothetical protein
MAASILTPVASPQDLVEAADTWDEEAAPLTDGLSRSQPEARSNRHSGARSG